MGLPRMLPVLKDLVVQPMSLIPQPKVESLHLSLWPLSGNKVRRQAFHKELRSSQLRPLDNPLEILSIPDWFPFREWCSKIPCDPTSSPLGVVADFLISRFDKGLTVVTLRSYRSAMASYHRGFSDGSSVTNSAFLTRLVRSFFLKRPPSKTLVPAWSLPAVLKVLASAPFEPLHIASLCLLTLKMAFLVAIASGHRVSSLKALFIDPGHIHWEASGVRLIPKMGFIAKNQSLKSGSVEIFLPAISTLSSVEEDKVWCPVRALKWYVDRT